MSLFQAIERGVFFEICYAPAIRDVTSRRYIISNAQALMNVCKGKVSSTNFTWIHMCNERFRLHSSFTHWKSCCCLFQNIIISSGAEKVRFENCSFACRACFRAFYLLWEEGRWLSVELMFFRKHLVLFTQQRLQGIADFLSRQWKSEHPTM